jgi:hypothetical protein
MPLDEQIGDAAHGPSAVEVADAGVREWRTITAHRPAPEASGPLVLHTMMQQDGRPINLGWTGPNRFGMLDRSNDDPTPSKVTDNA